MNKDSNSIGKVSNQTDIKIETIRYYEKIGLVDEPARSEGGNRLYLDKHVRQLKFIKRARQLGFSLDEIRTLLTLSSDKTEGCSYAKDIADKHLIDVEKKIRDLQQLARVLKSLSDDCERHDSKQCPILASLNSIA